MFMDKFIADGMEKSEFDEAREDLGFLEKDYLDVLSEEVTVENDNEEEFFDLNFV